MIAGGAADHPSHADIVGIVVFDEVLAARCVRHRRLKARRGRDHFVMRTLATGARVNGDRLALVEFGVARANDGVRHMNGIGQFIVCSGIRDVRRQYEHGDAPSRQCRLAGRDGLAAGLLGREDHLAEDAAAAVHLGEIDLLDRFEAQSVSHNLGRDQDDGRAVAMGLVKRSGDCRGRTSRRRL